ncbi:spore cortex-lytic enzyme [Marinicrinis sediminis]|uniref:Spore cortex-lytic enzyme n=1 Tax=Marinicrinis sediminis TaxID=1652465 RepID=A0ABW5R8A2_9BACL
MFNAIRKQIQIRKYIQSKSLLLLTVISVIVAGMCWSTSTQPLYSFSSATLEYGSTGDDVYELQSRLDYIGYYNGKIDGIFGTQTYWAVRNFQYQFGLEIDGIFGPKTKSMLVRATEDWAPGPGYKKRGGTVPTVQTISDKDLKLLARAVYSEARGEPYEGQVAVAAVILNRMQSKLFPNTISGIIFQPGAFTAVADGQFWLEPNDLSYRAARDAMNGWDPSLNALYYFNPDTATSDWIWSRPQIKKIGKHIFTK